MPGSGPRGEELFVRDKNYKKKLVIKGSADDHQLIQDDIVTVKPVPVELKWNMTDEEFDEYEKVACEMMVSNKEFREESLRRFLWRNNISVYSLKDVARLLKYKNQVQNHYFVFLTESERNKEIYGHSSPHQFGGLGVYEKVFHGFVPLRVVTRISLILGNFPELSCFVSCDSDNSCPEVFAAVTFGKNQYSEVFVVDMWNRNESVIIARREE